MKEKKKGNRERWQLYAILLTFAFALAVTYAAAQQICEEVCTKSPMEQKTVLSKTNAWEKQSSWAANGTNYTLWACTQRSRTQIRTLDTCYIRCRCPNNDIWEQRGDTYTSVIDESIEDTSRVLCTNVTIGDQAPALPCPC